MLTQKEIDAVQKEVKDNYYAFKLAFYNSKADEAEKIGNHKAALKLREHANKFKR